MMMAQDNGMELGKIHNGPMSGHCQVTESPKNSAASDYPDVEDDGHASRHGNVWTASSHVITAILGSGVLALSWSLAQLGWVAGLLVLFSFAIVTYITAVLLADTYRYTDPITGESKRNYNYMQAVRSHLALRLEGSNLLDQELNGHNLQNMPNEMIFGHAMNNRLKISNIGSDGLLFSTERAVELMGSFIPEQFLLTASENPEVVAWAGCAGGRQVFWCGLVQYSNLVGTAIGYTVTSSISMVAVQRSNCFHSRGHGHRCYASNNPYMAGFGVSQLIFSQIPNFSNIWWLSIVATVMSLFYSSVAFGLGISKAIEGGHSHGTLGGVDIGTGRGEFSDAKKTWHVLQALGTISFAYSFSTVLIEIQDTLRGRPKYQAENVTMNKATLFGITVTTLAYTAVASAGYFAFGNDVRANILTGFGFYNPYWLMDVANVAVVVHLVGAYQVFAQPVFAVVESQAGAKWPNSNFIHQEKHLKLRIFGSIPINWFRIVWRSIFVVFTTFIAMILPFFTDITGLIGAFSFWPLTVYFPVEIYIKARGIQAWTKEWTGLQTMSVISLLISVGAAIGSFEGIIDDLKDYKPFHTSF